jgi:hypothetical protein
MDSSVPASDKFYAFPFQESSLETGYKMPNQAKLFGILRGEA